ncbi:uncharacterized protein LOC124272431 [Haliotis rubra]|uniref:uncharacterized protein LOC124272431 n=1 Tax=Haliotis rubra TaxID=36100 RepID=UPI001EE51DD5|nr:uncharacterized protein LOC124272431 [Haliotis rubra]
MCSTEASSARRLAQLGRILKCSCGKQDLDLHCPCTAREFSTGKSSDQDRPKSGPLSDRYIAHLNNLYRLTADETGRNSAIHTPGLSYEAIDRDGNPTMASVLKFVSTARTFATNRRLDDTGRTMFDFDQLFSDTMSFVASTEVISEKAVYDTSVPKSPLDVLYQLGYVGKSSLSTVASIVVPSTGQTILRNINQFVVVDKMSRRPTPLPDWWREKYGGIAILKDPLIVPRLQRPPDAVQYRVNVVWFDTDNYKHTNYTCYVDYCVNALHYALEKGCMGAVTKDVVKRGIKSMRNTYMGRV